VTYRGQKEALAEFLPLDAMNWITCGNALRLDWLDAMDMKGTGVKFQADDLFQSPLDQAQINFEHDAGETYICGNPPYLGSTWQSAEQKQDLQRIFEGRTKSWKSLDYVAGWFMKAADFGTRTNAAAAFVSTNSICQGQQVPILWPLIFQTGHEISFAHTSFKWANLASHNAGVTVAIIGISNHVGPVRQLFSLNETGETVLKEADDINAYLIVGPNVIVQKASKPISLRSKMDYGNKPTDSGALILTKLDAEKISKQGAPYSAFVRKFVGSSDSIDGNLRYCLWITNDDVTEVGESEEICRRLQAVRDFRRKSNKNATAAAAEWPHRFQEIRQSGDDFAVVVPRHSSENRPYLPFVLCARGTIVADSAFAFYSPELWNLALFGSRLHLVWIATVCGKIKTDFRYSNTLGWNTFPVPKLTEKNKEDLTRCAEDILLAREAHFPATIADLYDPEEMPADLRAAHDRNDETLERIYIGRRFRNDTERLEKLFELYTKFSTRSSSLES
jgi:hypothetical protein